MFWHRANLRKDQKLDAIDSSDRSVSVWQLIEPVSHFTDKLNCSSKSSESQYRQLLLGPWVRPPLLEPSWGPLATATSCATQLKAPSPGVMEKWTRRSHGLRGQKRSSPCWYKAWFILLLRLLCFPFCFNREISWKIKLHPKSSAQAYAVTTQQRWRSRSTVSAWPADPKQCPRDSARWG